MARLDLEPIDDSQKLDLEEIPDQKKEFYEKYLAPSNPLRVLGQALSGLGSVGQDVASVVTGGYAPRVNIGKELRIGEPRGLLEQLAASTGRYLPFTLLAPEGIAGQAVAAGAEEGIKPDATLSSVGLSAGLNALLGGAFKGMEALRPTNMYKPGYSAEDIIKRQAAAAGTETPLGEIIGSPELKRYWENKLTKQPYSPTVESQLRTSELIKNRGESLLERALGEHNPETVQDELTQSLIQAAKEHTAEKNNLYNQFNDHVKKTGTRANLENFANEATKYKEAIEDSQYLKYEPDIKKILSKITNFTTTEELPTLTEANLLKGRLNQIANQAGSSPNPLDRNVARIFSNLNSTLKNDINLTIENSGDETLKNLYQAAEKNYAKNYSPFLEKDIYKVTSGQVDPDILIQKFLKTTKGQDRSNQLAKLMNKLPEDKKTLPLYSYLSKALDNEGNLNPQHLGRLIENIPPKTFKTLVPDQSLREQLLNHSKLTRMNLAALNKMFNPPTGQTLLDYASSNIPHMLIGGEIGGVTGALATLIGKHLINKHYANKMTNEAFRNEFISKVLSGDKGNIIDKLELPAKIIGRSFFQQNQEGNQ